MARKVDYKALKAAAAKQINLLPESIQLLKLRNALQGYKQQKIVNQSTATLNGHEARTILTSALSTFLLHVEGRKASAVGQGFYTIGPCGEENLAALGVKSKATDSFSLHYRHQSASIAREILNGRSLNDILLDKARAYCVSSLEPVTGGRHCSVSGSADPFNFYVTSTLASQSPPAVGRALGFSLSRSVASSRKNELSDEAIEKLSKFPTDAVSIVSFGDGTLNNNLSLSALNFADYTTHRGFKCPVLFVVSNNNICISLRNYGYLERFLEKERITKDITICNGMDIFSVLSATEDALSKVRTKRRPGILVVDNLSRRFGHAATDRQAAYLSDAEISTAADTDAVFAMIESFVSNDFITINEVSEELDFLESMIEDKFAIAVNEPKIENRESAEMNTSRNLDDIKASNKSFLSSFQSKRFDLGKDKRMTMRENMNKVFDEILTMFPQSVYVGEDVRHGGYYLVTDGLFEKHGQRVQDIPPDETMLAGLGIGYSQCGLAPIVEYPYSKYLDCGADMFFESVLTGWCTNGKQQDGILFRLQGFDRGVFGGNFHTHNSLYTPPGLELVCYSNGEDYVKGIRYCFAQSLKGSVVMSVDSTDLLNKRSKFWMQKYPAFEETEPESNFLSFDDVKFYSLIDKEIVKSDNFTKNKSREPTFVITYGTGVHQSVEALLELQNDNLVVIDAPYLSNLPKKLTDLFSEYFQTKTSFQLLLADPCKSGSGPLAAQLLRLKQRGLLPDNWSIVAASNTYNPLGSTVTFLSSEDIKTALNNLDLSKS